MGSVDIDSLEALLLSSRSSTEPGLKAVLARLSSEIRERLERGSPSSGDFFLTTLRALSRLKGTAHAEIRMTCLFDTVAYLFSNRYDVEALDAAKQFTALARSFGNKLWIRKAKMLEGIAFAQLGHVAEAFLCYANSLAIAREISDVSGEASILVNLGNALNYGGLYREAIPCLVQATVFADEHEEAHPFKAAALCNLAQSYLYLEEYPPGLQAITESLKLSEEPETAFGCFSRTIREFTFVQIALELGKLSSAREHSLKCGEYAIRSSTRRCEYVAAVAKGLCEIHGGDVERGLELLERALSLSGEEGTPQYIAALAALVKGYQHAGRPELALSRMNQLMNTIRRSREKGFLALISLPRDARVQVGFATEQSDLQAFQIREAELRVQVAHREVENSRIEMLERLSVTADLKEESSGEHGYRVGRLSSLIAKALEWSNDSLIALEVAARLHDIGKIAVPDRILLKSLELVDAERHFISTHTLIGAELLAKSNIPQLRMAEEIARCHHEWWNGEGYPAKLAGKRIPIHARIVALADVFDALTHGRPFSSPWPMERAIEEIRSKKGTQFDPELTDVFLDLIQRLRAEHADLDEYLGRAGRNSPFLQARNKIRLMLAEEREHEKMATVEGNETRH